MWRAPLVIPLFLGSLLLSACGPSATLTPAIAEGEGTRTYTIDYSTIVKRVTYTGAWMNGQPKGQGQYTETTTWVDLQIAPTTKTCSGNFGRDLAPTPRPAGSYFSAGDNWIFGRGTSRSNSDDSTYQGELVSDIAQGMVCYPYGKGTQSRANTSVTGTFNINLLPGPCQIEEKGRGVLSGICSNDPNGGNTSPQNLVVIPARDPFILVSGPAVYTETDGTRYEGTFNRSLVKAGPYRVTRPGQDAVTAYYDNNTLIAEHPSQDTLEKKATRCGSWYFMSGTCPGGQWSGTVLAYQANNSGMWRLQGRFEKDVPRGTIEMKAMHRDYNIRGTMPPVPIKTFSYSQAEIWSDGSFEYKGPMKDMRPDGTGLCRHEGKLEACEHADGQRVDALFKIREENRKLAQQIQLQQQQQQAAALRQQAAPSANADSNSGFQWGKLAALGTGAAIGGAGKLSSEAQTKLITGMVQDSMGGQQGMGGTQSAINQGRTGTSAAAAGTQGGQDAAALKQSAASCANEYDGPNNDPQADSFCKLAAFNACIHRKTGVTNYDAQGRSSCQQLQSLLSSTGSKNYQCRYCPYPY
jgi:hypothetical protein